MTMTPDVPMSNESTQPPTVPMLLVLSSETMNDPAASTTNTPRRFVVEEAIKEVTRAFSSISPNIPQTGLRTFAFMDDGVRDLGRLNPQTARDGLKQITWEGTPRVGPGLRRLAQVYLQDFGHATSPRLIATVVTDTIAADAEVLAHDLNEIDVPISVNIAVLGYGNDYKNALNTYNKIANEHANVTVFPLGEWTEPKVVAEQLAQTFS